MHGVMCSDAEIPMQSDRIRIILMGMHLWVEDDGGGSSVCKVNEVLV